MSALFALFLIPSALFRIIPRSDVMDLMSVNLYSFNVRPSMGLGRLYKDIIMNRQAIILAVILMAFSSVTFADWRTKWVKDEFIHYEQPVNVFRYKGEPDATPITKQVVVLHGGDGTLREGQITEYDLLGKFFSRRGGEVIVLDFAYYGMYNMIEDVAQNAGDTIGMLMQDGYITPGFWLYSTAGGSLIASAMLDYNISSGDTPPAIYRLVDLCDRVIFISGPAHGIAISDIRNTTITDLMLINGVSSLDSLDDTQSYYQSRRQNWVWPLIMRDGLRFVHVENDNIYCKNTKAPCDTAPSIPEAVDSWIRTVTSGLYGADALQGIGMLKVLSENDSRSAPHNPLQGRAGEFLDFINSH
ncbi:MAG: hypothetical protein KZQ99_21090 [Candidatus Thiodiazotropha sp. (ex Dulcina madagascariensis)]|nr:hypothetical protein [Candidatus Thiodiazotropha sp. (ex Dulcina madagascariensis)]